MKYITCSRGHFFLPVSVGLDVDIAENRVLNFIFHRSVL